MRFKYVGAICLLISSQYAFSAQTISPNLQMKIKSTLKKPGTMAKKEFKAAEKLAKYQQILLQSDIYKKKLKCFPFC